MDNYNPFNNIGPIRDQSVFFNRTEILTSLLNSLFSGKPACSSIVGQRKIGKTSLVHQLARTTTIQQLGFSGGSYLFLYFDCQTDPQALDNFESFYRAMLDRLTEAAPITLADLITRIIKSYEQTRIVRLWDKLIEELWKQGFYLIVIFDEFERAIMRETLIKSGLFGSLRSLGSHAPNFAWVTCTNRLLHTLFHESFDAHQISEAQRFSESEFYNIAPTHVVDLFSETDIHRMVTGLLASTDLAFSNDELDAIVRCGGTFPYFVQRICYHFFNAHLTGSTHHERIIQEYLRESEPIWEGFWNNLKKNQKQGLFQIADDRSQSVSEHEISILKDLALVQENSYGCLRPFSEEFTRYILSKGSGSARVASHVKHKIGGKYQVLNTVTMTDHSQLLKAWDERLGREVAIKIILPGSISHNESDQVFRNRLEREGRILAQLKHQSIGAVYDILLDPTGIVMEWIDGVSLQEFLNGDEKLPPVEIMKIGEVLLGALNYIHTHKNRIVHRDIKPSNVIVTSDRRPILIDFDVARATDQQTISVMENGIRGYIGTKRYSSPEQLFAFEEVGPPTDIFAMGVMLYELLTGTVPYEYGNHPFLYGGHFPTPEQHHIPDYLYEAVCAAICEHPSQRPSALEMQQLVRESQRITP